MFETRFNKSDTIYNNLLLIKGIGNYKINLICKAIGISPKIKFNNLSKTQTEKLYALLSKIKKQTFSYSFNSLKDKSNLISILSSSSNKITKNNLLDTQVLLINLASSKKSNLNIIKLLSSQQDSIDSLYSFRMLLIDDNLKDYEKQNIFNLIKSNSYRGRRIKLGYPSRGQRTRTNGKTARKLNRSKIISTD